MVITIQQLNSAKIVPKYRDAPRGNYAHPQNSTDLYQSCRRNGRAFSKRVCCLRGVTIRATTGANKLTNMTEKRTKTMKENGNKLFVTIMRTGNEDEPAKTVACYYCHTAVLTVNPEYHWIRQVKIQTFDPFGILRDFIFELHDDEDATIEAG